jgi:hypothetical protein
MLVRDPTFDLSASSPQWGDNAGAVVIVDAGGIIPAAVAPPRDCETILARHTAAS